MRKQKLKYAPLQEVVFELLWALESDESGLPTDPGFEFAQGVFNRCIKTDFPVHKRTIPENLSIKFYPLPIHQFWKEEATWPLFQFGPGILALNDTGKNYSWKESFLPNLKKGLKALQSSYSVPIRFVQARLRYVDATVFDIKNETSVNFIRRNLNTELVNHFPLDAIQRDVRINQAFDIDNASILSIEIQNGFFNKDGSPAIIWNTAVEKRSGLDFTNLIEWAEFAHKVCSETFVAMLNKEFYASFDS